MAAVDDWLKAEWLREYGIGIPFGLVAIGVTLIYWIAPGLARFGALGGYARLGILVAGGVGVGSLILAGYTYRQLDFGWWILTNDDAPEVDEPDA